MSRHQDQFYALSEVFVDKDAATTTGTETGMTTTATTTTAALKTSNVILLYSIKFLPGI